MYRNQSEQVAFLREVSGRCGSAVKTWVRICRRALGAVSVWAVMGVFLSACGDHIPSAVAQQQSESVTEPPYQVVTNVHQTMEWIVYPTADVIWDSAGTIITAQGSEELAPTTEEGWAEVVRAAATLAESGNLLMMPGRAIGDDWVRYSQQLVEAGKLALQAAEAQDSDALFDAGGEIYQVCKSCHEQYWVEIDESTEGAATETPPQP
jgi:hypothetical protein